MKNPPICNTLPTFKGWTKPGPLPAGGDIEPGDDETVDALCGHFRIVQLREGHRFSTDDLLVAWYGSSWCPSASRVLDLGSGIGSVAMIGAWRLRGAHFVTVEAQARSVALARRSVAYNGLEARFDLRQGDFRDPGLLAAVQPFDLVLASPPYWPPGEGLQSANSQRAACRFEMRGDVSDYCRIAARHLAPGGVVSIVYAAYPDGQLGRVFDGAAAAGLTTVRWRRVRLRAHDDYHIAVFVMHRTSDLPPDCGGLRVEESPIVVRRDDGELDPAYRALKLAIGFPP